MNDRFPDEIDEALWDEACRRADAIREFLKRNPNGATAAEVSGLAAEVNVSQATAYRLIKLFRAGGTVLSLVDRKRGRPRVIVPWMKGGRRSSARLSKSST